MNHLFLLSKMLVCTDGKVFASCGTACPTTCDNKDEIIPCTLQCVEGTYMIKDYTSFIIITLNLEKRL